jgi:hypothetical protein
LVVECAFVVAEAYLRVKGEESRRRIHIDLAMERSLYKARKSLLDPREDERVDAARAYSVLGTLSS